MNDRFMYNYEEGGLLTASSEEHAYYSYLSSIENLWEKHQDSIEQEKYDSQKKFESEVNSFNKTYKTFEHYHILKSINK